MLEPVRIEQIEPGENRIDQDEGEGEAEEEQPPRRAQHGMIEIGPARAVLSLDHGRAPAALSGDEALCSRGPRWCGRSGSGGFGFVMRMAAPLSSPPA